MLAIQNQISVLSKILTAKVQHQQILEHQQAVSAKKATTPVLSRSRKTSTNQDTSSQNGSNKEKSGISGNNSNIDNVLCDANNLSETEGNPGAEIKSGIVPESTGCIIT